LACIGAALLATAACVATDDGGTAARVLILANSREPESVQLAQFYAERRGVPAENILTLPLPPGEAVGWREFIAQLYQPLQDELVTRGWIQGMPSSLVDRFGRRRYSMLGHRIAYLVVCRGVPWRIEHDLALVDEKLNQRLRPELRTNGAAVDAELSLLAQSGYEITATWGNPLFANDRPSQVDLDLVVKVARLDGPSFADARQLVTSALEAERTGLLGRYYVDIGGPNRDGDRWLESTVTQLNDLGFDGDVEHTGATFGRAARFDAPVLYFGWYAGDLNGPFKVEGFRFPPGAVALHIHSYSAAALQSTGTGWCGPFVARGVTATLGNVSEPFLGFTHRPNLLLRALSRGQTLADAAYYALPVLSWQSILVGDPLYRPFAVPLEKQLAEPDRLPAALAPYAAIRQMKLLVRKGRLAEAQAVGTSAFNKSPDLALALALARTAQAAGDAPAGVRTLQFVQVMSRFAPADWAVVRAIAGWLAANGAQPVALRVYAALVHSPVPDRDAQIELLTEARGFADVAGELALSVEWQRQLRELAATAEKKPAAR
jgi:uncharacterized protein (TIGR03790 family)